MSPSTLKPCRAFSHYFQLKQPMNHACVPDAPEPTIVKAFFCNHAPSQPRVGSKLETVSFKVQTSILLLRELICSDDWFLTEVVSLVMTSTLVTRKTT